MPEPTTTTALATSGAVAATLGFASLSPAWLVMAFFGALALQAFGSATITRARAMAQIACSSVLGALIGAALAHFGGVTEEVVRLLLCALGGFGTYPLMQALIERLKSKLPTSTKV
jgi:uncharacterized membrane protein